MIELHLDGTNSVAMCEERLPPRVVLYHAPEGVRVWQFYRYCAPRIEGNRAATYRRVKPYELAKP